MLGRHGHRGISKYLTFFHCHSPFSAPFRPFIRFNQCALFCRARGTAQSLERGSFRMDLSTKFGKESPSRNLREKRWCYRPKTILSELYPAILDRIITGKYSKRINLIVIWAQYRKHLAVHRSNDTRTEIPWTKSCNELPDENSPAVNSVIFDRSITGENSQRINW